MSRSYKPLSDYARAVYGEDKLELELEPGEEADLLGVHLELQPCTYRRLSQNFAGADVEVGETYEAAYPLRVEQSLVEPGHIERVEPEKPAKKVAKKTAKKSAE